MNIRKAIPVLALLLALVLLAGCSTASQTGDGDSAYQKIDLVMAVNGTDTQIDSRVARYFADLVAERSGGNVTVDVFPNDQLAGGNATMGIEMIAQGSVLHRRPVLRPASRCQGHHLHRVLPQRLSAAHELQDRG